MAKHCIVYLTVSNQIYNSPPNTTQIVSERLSNNTPWMCWPSGCSHNHAFSPPWHSCWESLGYISNVSWLNPSAGNIPTSLLDSLTTGPPHWLRGPHVPACFNPRNPYLDLFRTTKTSIYGGSFQTSYGFPKVFLWFSHGKTSLFLGNFLLSRRHEWTGSVRAKLHQCHLRILLQRNSIQQKPRQPTVCVVDMVMQSEQTHILWKRIANIQLSLSLCIYIYIHMCTHIHTYITLHYIALHYTTLHYITLHYITYIYTHTTHVW